MLPTFIVVGSMKAGTTALFQYLSSHPDVFMPECKETGFFVERFGWHRGLEWYESLFSDAGDALAVGEASPAYSLWPSFAGVPERIAATLPGVRLVYLVRHPIERMRSQYLHAVARGYEHRSMTRAFVETPEYLDASRYATQVERYARHVDPSQLLVLTAEALRAERATTLARVLTFIGVDPARLPCRAAAGAALDDEPHQTRPRLAAKGLADRADDAVPAHLERHLRNVLADEVQGIVPWLGPDFDGWGLL